MKVLYTRVSTLDQKSDRQKMSSINFDLVLEDKCSGTINLFDREEGQKIKSLVNDGESFELVVYDIDRLGRNLLDIISTIEYLTKHNICVNILSQGLKTLTPEGTENPTSKMIISILGTVAEIERKKIVERTREGVAIAKSQGKYKGRKEGSKETIDKFLLKPKTKEILRLLKKKNTIKDVVNITDSSIGTVMKVKKLLSL